MKSTGVVRQIDKLGRVVIPIELRRNLDIDDKDSLEIYVENDHIILKKYSPACCCCFCSNTNVVKSFKNRNICSSCLAELMSQKDNQPTKSTADNT